MIKVQDLRIGNIIWWNPSLANPASTLPGLMVEVMELHHDKIGYVSVRLDHRVEPFEDDLIQSQPTVRSSAEFEAVELTAEILERAGFQRTKHDWRNDGLLLNERDNVYTCPLSNYSKAVELKFLHHLQNLYQVLTSHDLDVDL